MGAAFPRIFWFCQQDVAEIPGSSSGVQCATVDGPRSPAESDMWPDLILESLERQGLLGNFADAVTQGIHFSSDYSGIGTAEEAARCLCLAAEAATQRLCGKLPYLYVQRSGDKEAECRTVLLASSRKGGLGAPKCVFGDIGERCNKDIWNKVAEEIDRIHNSTRCCRPASIQLLLSRRNWRGS